MSQFFQFLASHWMLSSAFILVLILLLVEESKGKSAGGNKVSAEAAVKLINRDDAAILDIRSAKSFKQGHLAGSMNIANNDIEANINKLQKYKSKPLIVVCDRGQSAVKVVANLRRQGFDGATVLAGGIEAWQSAKYPLTQKNK